MDDLKPRQRDTILAALRFYQEGLVEKRIPYEIAEIASLGDTQDPMTVEEINDLCEWLNR